MAGQRAGRGNPGAGQADTGLMRQRQPRIVPFPISRQRRMPRKTTRPLYRSRQKKPFTVLCPRSVSPSGLYPRSRPGIPACPTRSTVKARENRVPSAKALHQRYTKRPDPWSRDGRSLPRSSGKRRQCRKRNVRSGRMGCLPLESGMAAVLAALRVRPRYLPGPKQLKKLFGKPCPTEHAELKKPPRKQGLWAGHPVRR